MTEPKQPQTPTQQTASSEVIREINRRIVLNLIRTRQPVSRADLARASGMQRSTISLIVEELVEGTWVLEGPTGRLPRGRRPTYLRLNDERAIIGVDIRPSQTTIALADVNGKFTSQEVLATPDDPQIALEEMIERIRRIIRTCNGRRIEGVGISLPGRYDRATDRLVFAPNLKWRDGWICGLRSRWPRDWKSSSKTPPMPARWRLSGSTRWNLSATWWC